MDSMNKDLSHSVICSHCSFDRLIPAICKDRICLVCDNGKADSKQKIVTNEEDKRKGGN